MNAVQSRDSEKRPFGRRKRTGRVVRSADRPQSENQSQRGCTKKIYFKESISEKSLMFPWGDFAAFETSFAIQKLSCACKIPVLFLLPNGRFSQSLDCTAFTGSLKALRCPNNVHFGGGKPDIRGIPVLNLNWTTFLFSSVIHESWMIISRLQAVQIMFPFEGKSRTGRVGRSAKTRVGSQMQVRVEAGNNNELVLVLNNRIPEGGRIPARFHTSFAGRKRQLSGSCIL